MGVLDDIEEKIQEAIDQAAEAASKTAEDMAETVKNAAKSGEEAGDRLTHGEDPKKIAQERADAALEAAKRTVTDALNAADDAKEKASDLAQKYGIDEKAETVKKRVAEHAGKLAEKYPLAGKALEIGNMAASRAYDLRDDIVERGFNRPDDERDAYMLHGALAEKGYDWWWHCFTGHNAKTGEEKSFFIEFFAINPALGEDRPVFGQLPENRESGVKPSYLMVKAGAWGEDARQIHRFFPWNEVSISDGAPFLISADNCFLSETRTLGRVSVSPEDAEAHPEWMTQSGDMIWDLSIDKQIAFNVGYGASRALRDADAFQMFWHAQGMKTAYEGRVVWNGELYMVRPETSWGYADKNWGSDFTSPWVWLASNHLTSNVTGERLSNSAFDIGGGRPVIGDHALDKVLLGAIWYEGEPYEFNFSHLWTLPKTQFKVKVGKNKVHWKVIQETPLSRMYTDITCDKKDMFLINYEAPDGSHRHTKLWNGGTGKGTVKLYKKSLKKNWEWELVDDIAVENCGCEYGEYEEEKKED